MTADRSTIAVLALVGLLTFGAALGATRIEPQVDFVDAVPAHPDLALYREVLARMDGVRFVATYMAYDPAGGSGDLRSDDGFDALVWTQAALTERLDATFPGTFSHHLSVYEAMRAGNYMVEKIATAGNPRPEAYALPEGPVTWAYVRDAVRDSGADDVLAADGQSALVLSFFATADNLEARRLTGDVATFLAAWDAEHGNEHPVTHAHQPSGLLWSSQYTDERNQQDLTHWGMVALAAVALSLLWVVRRPSNVLIAGATLVVAMTWTFGAMGWMGMRISFLTVFLAPVVMGIGVDHAVHLLHRYEEERDAGTPDAMRAAVRRTGSAVALAGATTTLGLAMLLLVANPLFAEIGGVAALGIAFAFLASLTVTPALRAIVPAGVPGTRGDRTGPRIARIAAWNDRNPTIAVGAVIAISLVAAVAATEVRIESGSADNEFPQDDPVILLQHRIEAEYGAFQRGYLIVRGDLSDPRALRALFDATAAATALPSALEATSITDLLIADASTDEGAVDILLTAVTAPEDRDRLPATRDAAKGALSRLRADPLWGRLTPFAITSEDDLAVVAVRLAPAQDQDALRGLRDAMQAQAGRLRDTLGPGYDVAAGGSPVNRAAVIEHTPWNVALATVGVSASVALLLLVAWRRPIALVGAGIVLLSGLWLLGAVAGLDAWYAATGSPNSASLTDMFLLAFAVTTAVGVDDFVHVVHRHREARRRGLAGDAARDEAFTHAGRAITGTTITTVLAFAALSGIYFLQSKNLAILTAVGVSGAYQLTLLIAPRALRHA